MTDDFFGPNGNAICRDCGQEMTPGTGCTLTHFVTDKGDVVERIPREDNGSDVCHDCNCTTGQLHHWGCDMERDPISGGQAFCSPHLKSVITPIVDKHKAR